MSKGKSARIVSKSNMDKPKQQECDDFNYFAQIDKWWAIKKAA
ncbi:hypothetical protein PLIP_a0411 [Pseudoalteromonas lipolytica LMEB 39]|nr:hypothetical protein [Pseudoalteromonas lipolytica LMEB 39]